MKSITSRLVLECSNRWQNRYMYFLTTFLIETTITSLQIQFFFALIILFCVTGGLWSYWRFYSCSLLLFQVCEQCPNVKFEREGYFVTVDIEKGMQDGQVRNINLYLDRFNRAYADNVILETKCYKYIVWSYDVFKRSGSMTSNP